MADIRLMNEWEEFEGLQEDFSDLKIDDKDDDDSRVLSIPMASHLDASDVSAALLSRDRTPTGFIEIDRDTLQKIFNEEFKRDEEMSRMERLENKQKQARQAGLQKKRMDMENKLQEEVEELAGNYQVHSMISCVRDNLAITTLKLNVSSISARALAKAMWINNTIICLDLSSCGLNDNAGCYIARILKKNNTLQKMELDNNYFGPSTAKAFAESLVINTSLVHLSLDSNALTRGGGAEADFSGVIEFSKAIAINTTLKFLNLWGTNLGIQGGIAMADGLELNDTILLCDVGHNSIHTDEAMRIAMKLDANLAAFELYERRRRDELLSEEEKQRIVQAAIDVSCLLRFESSSLTLIL